MGYQVKAPLVQAKKQDGSYVHVYEGGFLPDDIDADQLEQLVGSDMVVSADPPEDPPDDEPTDADGKPAGNASVDEWRAYAVSQGVPEDEAADMGRDEIRNRFK